MNNHPHLEQDISRSIKLDDYPKSFDEVLDFFENVSRHGWVNAGGHQPYILWLISKINDIKPSSITGESRRW